jgi:Disulphide bond corrector protein DsbC
MSRKVFTRLLRVTALAGIAAISVAGQDLRPASSSFQHVTVKVGASAPEVAPGGSLSLWADVSPKTNIHVYAAGSKDFEPVKLVLAPNRDVTMNKAIYPAATLITLPGVKERVPVYNALFRVTQPLVAASTLAHGAAIVVSGTLNYQACDDRVCFPPASYPVFWRITVK